MRTPISYYGGKQRMESIILPLIPAHRIYVEPFFGGGSIFFAKGPSFLEVINDLNDNVINFYRVLKEQFEELHHEVDISLMSESLHKKAFNIYQRPKGHSRVKRAWAFWYVTNFSFANKPGGGGSLIQDQKDRIQVATLSGEEISLNITSTDYQRFTSPAGMLFGLFQIGTREMRSFIWILHTHAAIKDIIKDIK